MAIRIAPTLAEMATYPFVRLEEARRALVAQGVEVIDFGKGDPNEPTDPIIREALIDAVPERAPYPLAAGLPELREAAAGWCARRFGVELDPDTELIPTYGSKEAIFSLAQVLVDPHSPKNVVVYGEPAYPVYERGALFAGAEVRTLPLAPRARLPARPRRSLGDDTAIVWVNYPHNPTGALAPLSFYEELAELAARARLRDRLRRGVQRALVRRAAGLGAPGRRPLARHRLPDAEQALVDDRLPLRLRRGAAGGDRRAQVVPADGRHRAAGVRAARVGRRLERRAARRGDARPLSREARRAPARA